MATASAAQGHLLNKPTPKEREQTLAQGLARAQALSQGKMSPPPTTQRQLTSTSTSGKSVTNDSLVRPIIEHVAFDMDGRDRPSEEKDWNEKTGFDAVFYDQLAAWSVANDGITIE